MTKDEKNHLVQPSNKRISEFDQIVGELVGVEDSVSSLWEKDEPKSSFNPIEEKSPIIINIKPQEKIDEIVKRETGFTVFTFNDFDEHTGESLELEVNHDKPIIEEQVPVSIDAHDVDSEIVSSAEVELEPLSNQLDVLSHSMTSQFSQVDLQIKKLMRDFETKLMVDSQKDQIIDNLHRELQEYKNNENQDRYLPLIRDLISLIDNLEKKLVEIDKNGYENPEKLVDMLKFTAQDVEDILYRQGIEALPNLGEKFDSKRHKVIKMIKTPYKEKDKQIAEVFGKAYSWEERQIRPELVAVYVYHPEAAEESKEL